MGIMVDLIIIGIIVLSTFFGYKRGLVALAIKLCAVIISIIITLILYKPVSNLIINVTSVDETLQNIILEKSSEILKNNNEEEKLTNQILEQAKKDMLPETSRDLVIQIINVCVMVILFIAIKLLLRFISAVANKVSKLPIINQLNKSGGIVYGILRGLIIVYVGLILISFVGKINSDNILYTSINQSNIGKIMYENNVLNILL